jgi:hypothetical protein
MPTDYFGSAKGTGVLELDMHVKRDGKEGGILSVVFVTRQETSTSAVFNTDIVHNDTKAR